MASWYIIMYLDVLRKFDIVLIIGFVHVFHLFYV